MQFTDIASSAGITFRHTNGKSGRYYFLETVASGGGFIDYDGDGDLDVYLLNGAAIPGFVPDRPLSSVLYRNDGDGTFTDVTSQAGVGNADGYGMGLAVADYDNDGDDDLFVTNYGANILYRNDGDGTFRDVTGQAGLSVPLNPTFSTSAAFLDYDRDGHLDLYVCVYVEFDFDDQQALRPGTASSPTADPISTRERPTCCTGTTATARLRTSPRSRASPIRTARASGWWEATTMATDGRISSWPTT